MFVDPVSWITYNFSINNLLSRLINNFPMSSLSRHCILSPLLNIFQFGNMFTCSFMLVLSDCFITFTKRQPTILLKSFLHPLSLWNMYIMWTVLCSESYMHSVSPWFWVFGPQMMMLRPPTSCFCRKDCPAMITIMLLNLQPKEKNRKKENSPSSMNLFLLILTY